MSLLLNARENSFAVGTRHLRIVDCLEMPALPLTGLPASSPALCGGGKDEGGYWGKE
jgi:hypothetical protein